MKRHLNGDPKQTDRVTETKNWLFRLGQPFFVRWDYDPSDNTYVTEVTNTVTIRSYDHRCCMDNARLVEQILQRAGIYPGHKRTTSWYSVTEQEDTKRVFYSVHIAHNDEKKIKRN